MKNSFLFIIHKHTLELRLFLLKPQILCIAFQQTCIRINYVSIFPLMLNWWIVFIFSFLSPAVEKWLKEYVMSEHGGHTSHSTDCIPHCLWCVCSFNGCHHSLDDAILGKRMKQTSVQIVRFSTILIYVWNACLWNA